MTILHSVFYLNSKSNFETELEKPFSIQYWMKHNPGNQRIDRPRHQTCRWTQSILQITPAISQRLTKRQIMLSSISALYENDWNVSTFIVDHLRSSISELETAHLLPMRWPVFHKISHSLICSFTLVALRFFGLLCEEIDPLNQVKDKKRKSVYGCNMADRKGHSRFAVYN